MNTAPRRANTPTGCFVFTDTHTYHATRTKVANPMGLLLFYSYVRTGTSYGDGGGGSCVSREPSQPLKGLTARPFKCKARAEPRAEPTPKGVNRSTL